MRKLWNKLSQIKHFDKVEHFGACFVATLAGSFIDVWFGVGLGVGLAIGKEYGDYNNPNSGWSWLDLVADALGIGVGLLIKNYLKI